MNQLKSLLRFDPERDLMHFYQPVAMQGNKRQDEDDTGSGDGGGGGGGGSNDGGQPVNPYLGGTSGMTGWNGGYRYNDPNADWIPRVNELPMEGGEYGFTAPNARRVAGPSGLEDWAAYQVINQYHPGWQWQEANTWLDKGAAAANWRMTQQPWEMDRSNYFTGAQLGTARDPIDYSGDAIAKDAGLLAAQQAFQLTGAPDIQNQFGAMGLGRSTSAGDAMAKAWAQTATPHIQAAIDRQRADRQNIIDAQRFAANQFANNAAQETARTYQGAQLLGGAASQYADLDQQKYNYQQNAIDTAMRIGAVGRGISQAENDAAYEDFLRRQGIAMGALTAPFGQLESTFDRVTSGGGGK